MDTWGHRALVCVLVVVGCLVAVEAGVGVAAGGPTDTGTDQHNESAADVLNRADEIQVTIDLHENRSATVEVDYRYERNGSNESDVDWESLESDVSSNPEPYIEAENESWQTTLEKSETDREMELSNFAVTTENSTTPIDIGHVRFRFEWSSFAYSELNHMEVGDALVSFALNEHVHLRITWPESYNATEISPEPTMREDNWAHWAGSEIVEFGDDEPRIGLLENGTDGGPDEEDELGWGIPWRTGVVAGAVTVAVLSIAGIVGWLVRRESTGERAARDEPTGAPAPTGDASNAPPPELLSNEEQVLRLLERSGGRLKQQQVVSELEWTEAKTSQVVTGLREDGEIEVFRIGRENVLVLADED